MKGEIIAEKKVFTHFTLGITFETLDEAKAFLHLANASSVISMDVYRTLRLHLENFEDEEK